MAGKVGVDLLMDGVVVATASVFTNEAIPQGPGPGSVLYRSGGRVAHVTAAPSAPETNGRPTTIHGHRDQDRTQPLRIRNSPVGYLATPGWTLNQGNGPRESRESIAFATAFNAPPEVTVAFSMLDAGVAANTQ